LPKISAWSDTAGRGRYFRAFAVKKNFTASSMRYVKFSQRAPIRALDARWFFAALPRVRARLAELRAARFAPLQNHQSTANSRTTREAAQARDAFTAGGHAPVRAVFINPSEDEP
jgi:hypothetical protein